MSNIHIVSNHEFAPTFKKRYASKQTTTNACIHYCLCLMYFEHIYIDLGHIQENMDIMIISVSTFAYYIQKEANVQRPWQ